MKNIIVLSATSDIGMSLVIHWKKLGYNVIGTYNTISENYIRLMQIIPDSLFHCDLLNISSLLSCVSSINNICESWDALVLAPGNMNPIGKFSEVPFSFWRDSCEVNFLAPLQFLREIINRRNLTNRSKVIFFSGAGTNSAAVNYSAYSVSKIALIKMVEILSEEVQDASFVILGPGWIKSKIHDITISAGKFRAGVAYDNTIEKVNTNLWHSIDQVIRCCDWVLDCNSSFISGRNFSVVHDMWGTHLLEKALFLDNNMYKLRRSENNWGK